MDITLIQEFTTAISFICKNIKELQNQVNNITGKQAALEKTIEVMCETMDKEQLQKIIPKLKDHVEALKG